MISFNKIITDYIKRDDTVVKNAIIHFYVYFVELFKQKNIDKKNNKYSFYFNWYDNNEHIN